MLAYIYLTSPGLRQFNRLRRSCFIFSGVTSFPSISKICTFSMVFLKDSRKDSKYSFRSNVRSFASSSVNLPSLAFLVNSLIRSIFYFGNIQSHLSLSIQKEYEKKTRSASRLAFKSFFIFHISAVNGCFAHIISQSS